MAKVKVIKFLKSRDGSVFIVGKGKDSVVHEETSLTCMSITHRRDGETGLFKAEKDEARYEIVCVDTDEQVPFEVHVVPQREVASLVFTIDEKEKKEKQTGEADVVMEKA